MMNMPADSPYPDTRPHTWRERHPFLYGMSQTFGIFQVRQPVLTAEQHLQRVADKIADVIAEVERRQHRG